MRFEQSQWLLGTFVALVVAMLLIAGALQHVRWVRRFGDEERVQALVTERAGLRRALEGVALVLAVALAFVALAKPQYGKGTRLIPATNLDIVVVLDFSKSMYARDVTPSRIARARSEVSALIQELGGARFGAVAFAGEPMSFPLTSDGAAIAQFFRGLSPNDMPVGGTAIARALEAGRELFARDPLSQKHSKAILLITDGEDLEGDPLAVAKAVAGDGIAIHVVQIGGRTPEPIPDVNDQDVVVGMRTDREGKTLTTSLSAAGEEQLTQVAEVTGGNVVRSKRGGMGIDIVKQNLKRHMSEELSERVETVYADVYWIFLGASAGLLLVEAIGMLVWSLIVRRRDQRRLVATKRRTNKKGSLKQRLRRAKRLRQAMSQKAATGAGLVGLVLLFFGCDAERQELFSRSSPVVDQAISALDAGSSAEAVELLSEYLSTGKCEGGAIGAPGSLTDKADASFDLGLGLFKIAEQFGKPFDSIELRGDGGMSPEDQAQLASRSEQVDCALRITRAIAIDTSVPTDLRARAYYLSGNLEFLRRDYKASVLSYDLALRLVPGMEPDAGDPIGRDAAYNRAIALRRIQDEPDAAPDADPDGSDQPDAGDESTPDAQPDADPDAGPPDAGDDGGNQDQDSGPEDEPDAGNDGAPPPAQEDAGENQQNPSEPPPSDMSQDERMLDMLEQTPTLQEHNAKNRASARPVGMEDK